MPVTRGLSLANSPPGPFSSPLLPTLSTNVFVRRMNTCFVDLVDADPGFDEGGDVLRHPGDEAIRLVVHEIELLGHLRGAVTRSDPSRGSSYLSFQHYK